MILGLVGGLGRRSVVPGGGFWSQCHQEVTGMTSLMDMQERYSETKEKYIPITRGGDPPWQWHSCFPGTHYPEQLVTYI
jgi:hypothetical protein